MTKRELIALADVIRKHNAVDNSQSGRPWYAGFTKDEINTLADFCASTNPAFKRDRWLGYIDGTNGPNGGAVKALPVEQAITDATAFPSWMSPEQCKAVKVLFGRSPDGADSLGAFVSRFTDYGDYCGIGWCGMFIGIEKDGYTHS